MAALAGPDPGWLRALVDRLPVGAACREGENLHVNQAVETITGYRRAELNSVAQWFACLHQAEAGTARSRYQADRALDFPAARSLSIRHRDGEDRHLEFSACRLAGAELWILHDITGRVQTEQALEVSQYTLAALMSNLPGMAYRCRNDQQWTMEYVSEGCLRLTGYAPEDLLGNRRLSYALIIHPEDRLSVWAQVQTAIQKREAFHLVYRIITAGGVQKWVWEQGRGLYSAAGDLTFLEGFITDITERKRMEDRVREQAELLDFASDAIMVCDLGGRITYWNRGAERIFGWSAQEAVGTVVFGALMRLPGLAVPEPWKRALKHGSWNGELMLVTKAGKWLAIECRWSAVRPAGGPAKSVLMVGTDVTERKRLESQLLRSERLQSVGTLASGIVHDLNNILAPILMSVQHLRESCTTEMDQLMLETMETCARRGADVLRQVLTFARGGEGTRALVRLSLVVDEVRRIIQETFPKSIQIIQENRDQPWHILGDTVQLQQVVMNLCVNARDAMPDGGRLSLTLENVTLDGLAASERGRVEPGDYVVLRVEDTGVGMPPEVQCRIFEPFYTTKAAGQGTGLGLASVQGIVVGHGGFVEVNSEPGNGSRFSVWLPAQPMAEPVSSATPLASAPRGNGELILVVDDELVVRESLRWVLEHGGYQVVAAHEGREAIECFRLRREEIQAVVTDLMMPIMDGATMVAQLREIDPSVRVLVVSGANDARGTVRRVCDADAELAKPFTATDLLVSLALLLARNPGIEDNGPTG
jgi:PAS domain S-box-containing protein